MAMFLMPLLKIGTASSGFRRPYSNRMIQRIKRCLCNRNSSIWICDVKHHKVGNIKHNIHMRISKVLLKAQGTSINTSAMSSQRCCLKIKYEDQNPAARRQEKQIYELMWWVLLRLREVGRRWIGWISIRILRKWDFSFELNASEVTDRRAWDKWQFENDDRNGEIKNLWHSAVRLFHMMVKKSWFFAASLNNRSCSHSK